MSEPGEYVILAISTPTAWDIWRHDGRCLSTFRGALMTREFAEKQLGKFHPTRQAQVVHKDLAEPLLLLLNG